MNLQFKQVVVYVSDMRRSVAFYRDTLGMRLVSESPAWSELAAGDFTLALHASGLTDELPGTTGLPAGRAELIFTVDNLDQAVETLRARGAAIDGPKRLQGIDILVAFLRDPDGMAIELME